MPQLPPSAIRIAVDAAVFTYAARTLRLLLVQTSDGRRALPGGFVRDGEGLLAAVERELDEEAGITVDYLEQLRTYGDDVARDPRAQVITVAYWAVVKSTNVQSATGSDAHGAEWCPLTDLPGLAYDHDMIAADALTRLKAKLTYQPIGFDLLPDVFGFSELEQLYETILERPIDRRNFRRKVLSFGVLTETGETRSEGAGRPATLYRFNEARYRELERDGFYFEIK